MIQAVKLNIATRVFLSVRDLVRFIYYNVLLIVEIVNKREYFSLSGNIFLKYPVMSEEPDLESGDDY